MGEKNTLIYVKVYGREEYVKLLDFLDERGYRWKSGQRAANPPAFFRPGCLGENTLGIRVINTVQKEISWLPVELFSEQEREEIQEKAISVDNAIVQFKEESV